MGHIKTGVAAYVLMKIWDQRQEKKTAQQQQKRNVGSQNQYYDDRHYQQPHQFQSNGSKRAPSVYDDEPKPRQWNREESYLYRDEPHQQQLYLTEAQDTGAGYGYAAAASEKRRYYAGEKA